MAFYFSDKSIANLKGLHPNLIKFANELIKIAKYDFAITQGVRTTDEQFNLYQQGRSKKGKRVTNADGKVIKSNHQVNIYTGYGHAFDIAIFLNNKIMWKEEIYDDFINSKIRELMENYNIEWGGDWKFKDRPHFEYAGGKNGK